MAKHDERHLTTEQLSAYIDKQLSAQEQAEYAAHLQGCARCQQTLVSLQQTAVLLRMLPQPSLPRSFALPAGVSHLQERPALQAVPTAPRPPARQPMWQHYMRRSLRVVSTIAAVIGLVFLLSSVVISLPRGGGASTSSGSTAAPAATQHRNLVPGSTDKGATPTIASNTKPTAPAARPTPVNSPAQPSLPLPNLATPLGQQEVGFILFVLGAVGVLLTRRRQRDRSTS